MKKNIIFSALITLSVLFTSCEENFDAKIYGSLSTTNFPSSESDYESYLMNCYIPFSVNWGYSFGSVWQHNFYVPEGGIMRMLDSTSDYCASWNVSSWGGNWLKMTSGQFDDLKYVSRGSGGDPSHFEKVRDITRFTAIIGTIEKSATLSETKKKEFSGEAHLLRGMMMYYMLHFYGPVPVILNPDSIGDGQAESNLGRPSLDTYTTYITDDLENAVANMKEKQSEKGRYTCDYARYCLMRHYLNEGAHVSGYYQKAYDLFSKFTGGYSLYTKGDNPYADQFKVANKFNNEVIMAVSVSNTATGSGSEGNFNPLSWYVVPNNVAKYDSNGNSTPFVNQGGGWGQCFNIDPKYYDTFENGDLRAKTILTSYYNNSGSWVTRSDIGSKWSGFIINKYPIETATSFQGTDIPLARWADVLLMSAEADVRLHNAVSTSAINSVNQVRSRAGLGGLPSSSTSSVSSFLDALLTERGHELMYEGCRKVDLIRFNKYYTVMKAYGRTPSSQYFPLPNFAVQQAEEAGHTLTQYFTRDDYDGPKK
jgi:SusD family.